MLNEERDEFLGIQDTLKALADPIRREILNLLKNGRLSAGEICEHFSVTGASISRHLAILKEADLIRNKREGKFIYYELNTSVLEDVMLWIIDLKGVSDDEGNDKKIYEVIKNEYVIGKSSVSNVVDIDLSGLLNEAYVSRRHARIFQENESYYITDEGSRNGTDILKLNNRRINLKSFKKEKIVIGDVIIIKDIKILVN